MSESRRVELTVADGIAQMTLVRAEARNAIDPAWVQEFDDGVRACAEDESIRAVLISAEGDAFSVGGDLRHFNGTLDRLAEELDAMIGRFHSALGRLADLPVPVVCAVNGAVAGGALGLLWCSDVVIAVEDAQLAAAFTKLALSGDGGSTWFLPRVVGLRRAHELLVEGRVLSASEAAEWGLVSKVVPSDRLSAEAVETTRRYAAGPTIAHGELRRLLRNSFSRTFEEGLEAEHQAMVRCGGTEDARDGVAAFVERREPRYQGR
jgi:2-(1,2-epoxy-1,2-dihydrophenyl)acetyl-CoA isomerase